MPPKTKFRKKGGSSIQKRLKKLEIAQKADDKRTENKNYYVSNIVSMNTTWQTASRFILNLTQNATENGRIGNSVNLRSARIRFNCKLPRTVDGAPVIPGANTKCRVLVVHNMDCMSTLAITDILKTPVYKMTSYYQDNVAESKTYKVLGDYKFSLNTENKGNHQFVCNIKLPKSGRVVNYPSNSATVPNNYNVSIFWTCEDIGPLSASQPDMFYYLKSQYEDA